MTQDSIIAVLRHVLSIIGGIAVGRGIMTDNQLVVIIGLIPPLVAASFAFRSATPLAQIEKVASNPNIAKITPAATEAGIKIVNSSPSPKVSL